MDDALEADFGAKGAAFVGLLKQCVLQVGAEELRRRVNENNGALKFKLEGQEVVLQRGTHFYLSRKDSRGMVGN